MTTTPWDGTRQASGVVRPGLRLYAIGDVHGEVDLFDRMAARIEADLADDRPGRAFTVFLGDYIDRGPDSAGVIDRLARGAFPTTCATLRGNHEQLLLDGLERPRDLDDWLANGGLATARSYGLAPDSVATMSAGALQRALLDRMPTAHLAILRATAPSTAIDGYFFCHAGIQPGVPFDQQSPEALLWIRRPFHSSTLDHGKVVVHGHTPVPSPESLFNRINIDTGAFRSGVLSCAVLEGASRRFLSVAH